MLSFHVKLVTFVVFLAPVYAISSVICMKFSTKPWGREIEGLSETVIYPDFLAFSLQSCCTSTSTYTY